MRLLAISAAAGVSFRLTPFGAARFEVLAFGGDWTLVLLELILGLMVEEMTSISSSVDSWSDGSSGKNKGFLDVDGPATGNGGGKSSSESEEVRSTTVSESFSAFTASASASPWSP